MLKIDYVVTTSVHELSNLLNIHWSKFNFVKMAENGSYRWLNCDDKAIEELEEDYRYYMSHGEERKAEYIHNDIKVCKILRNTYLLDKILVSIDW